MVYFMENLIKTVYFMKNPIKIWYIIYKHPIIYRLFIGFQPSHPLVVQDLPSTLVAPDPSPKAAAKLATEHKKYTMNVSTVSIIVC